MNKLAIIVGGWHLPYKYYKYSYFCVNINYKNINNIISSKC